MIDLDETLVHSSFKVHIHIGDLYILYIFSFLEGRGVKGKEGKGGGGRGGGER